MKTYERQHTEAGDTIHSKFNACCYRETCRAQDAELERLRALVNTPQLHDFGAAVVLEAAHQRERWGSAHDAGKAPEDWFWLLGYLAGKALAAAKAGDLDKALHHTISSAATLANWHAAMSGEHTGMRPGIGPVSCGLVEAESTTEAAVAAEDTECLGTKNS